MGMQIKANLFVIPTEFRGRRHPVHDGYRPDWRISFLYNGLNGGAIKAQDPIAPGKSGCITIFPFCEEFWGHLKPKDQITMHEGSRLIGVAILQEVSQT